VAGQTGRIVRYQLGGQVRQVEVFDAELVPESTDIVRAGTAPPQILASAGDDTTLDDLMRLLGRVEGSGADKLPVVFACLRLIISRLQSMPPRVMNSANQQVADPVWVRTPNANFDWQDTMSQCAWSLLQEGELFLLPGFDLSRRPVGFLVVDPNAVQVYRSASNDVARYAYRVNGYPVGRLIHVRYLALPGEPRGMGTSRARRRAVQISSMSEETMLRHFSQGARLQTVFTAKDQNVSPAMAREASFELQAHYGGVENAWRPVAIGGGWNVQTLSQNAEQAQYSELSHWADARIASQIYGVDPSLLGITLPGSQLTYQNTQDREGNLFRDAVRPVAHRIEAAFGRLVSAGRRFDLWDAPVLAGGPRDRVAYAKELAAINQMVGGWLINHDQILEAIGLPALGDNPEIPTLPSAAATPEPDQEPEESPEPDETEQSYEDRGYRGHLWRADLSPLGISPNGH